MTNSQSNASVFATAEWDPDGPGPEHPLIVVGGSFEIAGNILAKNIAAYDARTGVWTPLGSGTDRTVTSIVVTPNNDLIAAGPFTAAGGVPASGIAQWSGTTWSPVGSGLPVTFYNGVIIIAALPNGHIVAAGDFIPPGGVFPSNVALWNGAAWSLIGTGPVSIIRSLLALPNGDLVVGRGVGPPGTLDWVYRWDGAIWAPLGSASIGNVYALARLANGDLVAGGTNGTPGQMWRWDWTAWSPMAPITGLLPAIKTLMTTPNGSLVVGGNFTGIGGVPCSSLTRWDGTAWSSIGSGVGTGRVDSMTLRSNGDLIVGGLLLNASGTKVMNVAAWNGVGFASLGLEIDERVLCLAGMPNGEMVVGGHFRMIDGVAADRIARWDGTSWTAVGAGTNDIVRRVHGAPNGDVVAAGDFTLAGGTACNRIARWDGSAWSPLGAGIGPGITSLATTGNGDLIAGGITIAGGAPVNWIAGWNGFAWSSLGSGLNGPPQAMLTNSDGDLIVGGNFSTAGGVAANKIARWDGTTWSPLGAGLNGAVIAMTWLPDGGLVAAGLFTTAGGAPAQGVARWDGIGWSAMGACFGDVFAVATLPDGDVLGWGDFSGSGAEFVARFDGGSWLPTGSANASISAMSTTRRGEAFLCGTLTTPASTVFPHLSRYRSTCAPSVTTNGVGCSSSGGANVLTAASQPWVDATFRARGTGLPNLCVALALTSFAAVPQGVAPLASFFVQSPPGCDLLVAPDIVHAIGTATGTVESQLFLPNVPPLVGTAFYHQMIPLEVDASLNIVSITATNSLRLVAGDF